LVISGTTAQLVEPPVLNTQPAGRLLVGTDAGTVQRVCTAVDSRKSGDERVLS
jgi:hypothetical protein